jgi:hypothetical protein
LAFFTWFSFTNCFLLVGTQSPRFRLWLILFSFFSS